MFFSKPKIKTFADELTDVSNAINSKNESGKINKIHYAAKVLSSEEFYNYRK